MYKKNLEFEQFLLKKLQKLNKEDRFFYKPHTQGISTAIRQTQIPETSAQQQNTKAPPYAFSGTGRAFHLYTFKQNEFLLICVLRRYSQEPPYTFQ